MQAIQVSKFGDPEVLQVTELAKPSPAAEQLVVKIHASGVNPVDTYIRAGVYPVQPELPWTPGFDGAGVVESVGDDVTEVVPGQRVWVTGSLTGTAAEYALCLPEQVHPLPDKVGFAAGAALGIPAAAAWRALFIRGCATPGETVLIHGASGAAGQAAVQLARAAGLHVIGTAGNEAGRQVVMAAGAHAVYEHADPQLAAEGISLIIEMLADKNLETDLQLLSPGGRVVIVGNRGRVEIDPRLTMGKESEIRGMSLFAATDQEKEVTWAALGAALETGVLAPRIAVTFPLTRAALAHQQVMQNLNHGKIILQPGPCSA